MKAVAHHYEGTVVGKAEREDHTLEMKKCAERIWNAISKYVTFDNDAIFKDPNWPYLWGKKQ